jgi:hypothetical protein
MPEQSPHIYGKHMSRKLEGKIALITGAAAGIGAPPPNCFCPKAPR